MEPTIYKPSIYKGAGIYKTGAEGGGQPQIYGSVTIGNRNYKTIQYNNKEWLAENLDYKFEGCLVGMVQINSPCCGYYNNDEDFSLDGSYKCGLLYNWYAAKYLDDNKLTLLPSGWRVPTVSDYTDLLNSLIPISQVGVLIKAKDNSVKAGFPSSWGGLNFMYMSVLPTGAFYNGSFGNLNVNTVFWTSEEYNGSQGRNVFVQLNDCGFDHYYKESGYCLRLCKDL